MAFERQTADESTSAMPQTAVQPAGPTTSEGPAQNPWPALWALVIGFFMILVDTTIVSVANPAIMAALDADVNSVVWVTSAYLLAYAVPLLITGRLGDRFGPKSLYLVGLVVFTLASLWCGLSGTHRDAHRRPRRPGPRRRDDDAADHGRHHPDLPAATARAAMGLWGATAGVATLVGPILGGVLVDGLGWEWIFFINVPVGDRRRSSSPGGSCPNLATHPHTLRHARRGAERRRHVPARLRHPGGRDATTGAPSPAPSRSGA